MTDPTDTAFPFVDHISAEDRSVFYGLTKREYFAAMAMQGLMSNSRSDSSTVIQDAMRYADALIVELNKEVKP